MIDESGLHHLAEVDGDAEVGVYLTLLPIATVKWLHNLGVVSHLPDLPF